MRRPYLEEECSHAAQKWFFLSSAGSIREFFSVGKRSVWRWFSQYHGCLPTTGSPWSSWLSELSTLNLQQFVNYISDFCSCGGFCSRISALVSCDSPYLLVSPILGPVGLLCVFLCFMNPRRVVDFSVCLASYLLLGWRVSKVLTCRTGNICSTFWKIGICF